MKNSFKDLEERRKKLIQADLRLAKAQVVCLFIISILIALLAVLFTIKGFVDIANAKSVRTSASVEEYLTVENGDSVRQGNEIIFYKY